MITRNLYTLFDTGDELVPGPLKGVRFWVYRFVWPNGCKPPCTITSFQADIDWTPGQAAESEGTPTMENKRGLNVYKTVDDALRGSADGISGVIGPQAEGWANCKGGIVLGEVEFWGPTIEWEFGYTAQFVKPTRFLMAWGYNPEQIVEELNTIWFGEAHG